jgi:poly(A) polymerase
MYDKSNASYIGVVVPEPLWPNFESIRQKYMRYHTSPAHVTIVDPFIEYKNFEFVIPQIQQLLLVDIEPFTIRLETFKYFKQRRGKCIVYLEPIVLNDQLKQIQSRIVSICPNCDNLSNNYKPHVTMASFDSESETISMIETFQKQWTPIEFEVREIHFLTKVGRNPYQVRRVVPLAGDNNNDRYFEEIPEAEIKETD